MDELLIGTISGVVYDQNFRVKKVLSSKPLHISESSYDTYDGIFSVDGVFHNALYPITKLRGSVVLYNNSDIFLDGDSWVGYGFKDFCNQDHFLTLTDRSISRSNIVTLFETSSIMNCLDQRGGEVVVGFDCGMVILYDYPLFNVRQKKALCLDSSITQLVLGDKIAIVTEEYKGFYLWDRTSLELIQLPEVPKDIQYRDKVYTLVGDSLYSYDDEDGLTLVRGGDVSCFSLVSRSIDDDQLAR